MRGITFFISMLMLLQSTSIGMNDILRVNYLVEHASYHSQEYGDSLFVFISKHYGELKKDHMEHTHDDHGDHEKLPFNHSSCSHAVAQVFLLQTTPLDFSAVGLEQPQKSVFFYQAPSSSQYLMGIFQPPKAA